MSAPHGVLVVDKPGGPTSHDVVAQARRLYGTRAVGHAGTLDPMASGVLLLAFGEATKLAGHLTGAPKSYRATVRFGLATDSLDATGNVLESRPLADGWLDRVALDRAIAAERARSEQVPPAISAIHVDGRRAYDLTRRGAPPALAPRPVHVESLALIELLQDHVSLELRVSKGYYVRALARDLGAALGVPACLSELRRTSSGGFAVDEACRWPALAPLPLLPLGEVARRCLPFGELSEAGELRARRGQRLAGGHFTRLPGTSSGEAAAWLGRDGELIALGTEQAGVYRVLRGFNAT